MTKLTIGPLGISITCDIMANKLRRDVRDDRSRREMSSRPARARRTGKKHRGEPGHTRDTRAHEGTRITQTNLTTIQTHQPTAVGRGRLKGGHWHSPVRSVLYRTLTQHAWHDYACWYVVNACLRVCFVV